jgi:hypothetical protein
MHIFMCSFKFVSATNRRISMKILARMTEPTKVIFFTLIVTHFICMTSLPSAFAIDEYEPQSEPDMINGAESFGPFSPHVFEGDLRNLPRAQEWHPGDPVKEVPKRTYPRGTDDAEKRRLNEAPLPGPDPLLNLQEKAPAAALIRAFGSPDLNFAGQGFSGVVPPDTVGDVGRNYYIQMVNHPSGSSVTIYNKNDGSLAAGPTILSTLGSGACASGSGDPIVLFDHLANRWLMSEFADSGNHLCIYISQTSDPISGGWFGYDFQVPQFPDYPKYAVWPDAYYVSSNESAPAVYALERNQMLNGSAASGLRFTAPNMAGFGFQALTPAEPDGPTAPPAGSPGIFIRHRDDEAHNPGSNNPNQDFLEIWELSVDFTTPANSTFTGPFNIATTEFDSDLCGLTSFECFPQPGGTGVTLDPLREVVMWRLQYRNFGIHEALVGNLVTDVDGNDHGGIRWFELRKSGGGSWSLHQEGTYAPDNDNRWMGSIAMDGAGNIALGYSVSSSSTLPGIRYAGRQATDPSGTMPQGEFTIINGSGSSFSNRWGDYSSMNLDPDDDRTFWYTNQYALSNGTWGTQIAAFSFEAAGPAPHVPLDLLLLNEQNP